MSHPEFWGEQTADAVEFRIAPVVRRADQFCFSWYKSPDLYQHFRVSRRMSNAKMLEKHTSETC